MFVLYRHPVLFEGEVAVVGHGCGEECRAGQVRIGAGDQSGHEQPPGDHAHHCEVTDQQVGTV